jgi:hypothetical protein
LGGFAGTEEEDKEAHMRQVYRLFMFLMGVGVVALGLKVSLIGHRLPPGLSDPLPPKVIGLLLYLGIGIGCIWEGLAGKQRDSASAKSGLGWALLKNLCLLPLVSYGVLIVYACYAWFQVGHWPYYAHPDPSELPYRLLGYITGVIFLAGAISILLLPVGLLIGRLIAAGRGDSSPSLHRSTVLYLAGAALWLTDFSAERTAVLWTSNIGWFID